MKLSSIHRLVGLLVLMVFTTAVAPSAVAQPGHHFGHPGPPPFGPPHHHGPNDFDRALGVIGAVGAVAAIANGYSPYGYYRHAPAVVVVPSRPSTVVVERPVVVEKSVVIEKPVVVEKQVVVKRPQQYSTDYYSPKLGATFIIQNMRIPGYDFTAARLTSDPLEGSPLAAIGLRKGDVVTRLDNNPADSVEELEKHEKNTLLRYIKTGTTKVLLAKIYIPTDSELNPREEDTFYAP